MLNAAQFKIPTVSGMVGIVLLWNAVSTRRELVCGGVIARTPSS